VHLSQQTVSLIIQIVSYALWFPLKVLGIQAMLKTGVRPYFLVFSYSVVTFLLAVVQAPVALAFHSSKQDEGWFDKVHYSSQAVIYTFIVAIVLSFIYRASAAVGPRRLVRTVLFAGGFAFVVISGWIHYDRHALLGAWVTRWTRDLNFAAAVLDLVLWGMLITTRRSGSQMLLLLTGGMGIMFSGEAIGAAVRDLGIRQSSYAVFLIGHAIVVLADAAFLYVWWQAFRREAATRSAVTASSQR
jgi:hypothetical protein